MTSFRYHETEGLRLNEPIMTAPEHCDYPHHPGALYDCPACDSACHCTVGSVECVFDGEHNGTHLREGIRP